VDTILRILLDESYSGIHALADLSVCINKYLHPLIREDIGMRFSYSAGDEAFQNP